ncbi:MAG: TonB family protein [Pseudobdellovibrionaceae bacterium]|jgi:TonB family protein|nr:TonB family protein [Pseudobdellovibrionaceae bacterium]
MDDSNFPLFDKKLRRKEISFLPYSLGLHGLVIVVLTGVLGNWGAGVALRQKDTPQLHEEIWIDMVEMVPEEDVSQKKDVQADPDFQSFPKILPQPFSQEQEKTVIPNRDVQLVQKQIKSDSKNVTIPSVRTVQMQRSSQSSFSLFDSYQAHVHQKILARKFYPKQALRSREEGRVHVSFSIDRMGNVSAVKVVGTSFSHALDSAAIKAVQLAAPFDIPPVALPEESLRFTVPLAYRLVGR